MELQPESPKEREHLAALAGDILQDVQKLVEQHVRLAKLQFFEDWGSAKPLAFWFTLGLVALIMVGLLSALVLTHLLNATTSLPLWACYGIVDLACVTIGVIGFSLAREKAKELSFVNE